MDVIGGGDFSSDEEMEEGGHVEDTDEEDHGEGPDGEGQEDDEEASGEGDEGQDQKEREPKRKRGTSMYSYSDPVAMAEGVKYWERLQRERDPSLLQNPELLQQKKYEEERLATGVFLSCYRDRQGFYLTTYHKKKLIEHFVKCIRVYDEEVYQKMNK